MKNNEIGCTHACRNTCAMLVEAVGREERLSAFYAAVAAECDYPDVQSVLVEVAALRARTVQLLRRQLDAMHVRGEVLDGVQSSFDPAGC